MKYLVEVLINNSPTLKGNIPFHRCEEATAVAIKLCAKGDLAATAYRVVEIGWGAPRRTLNSPAWINAMSGQFEIIR
jgi:hypothetical protein